MNKCGGFEIDIQIRIDWHVWGLGVLMDFSDMTFGISILFLHIMIERT